MGFLGGGSGSASNTLSNIINFSPAVTIGDSNKSDLTSALDQRASSEALAKDQQSTSAGVSGSGSATGGTASLSDVMPQSQNSGMMSGQGITLPQKANSSGYGLYAVAGSVALASVLLFKAMNKKG